MHTVEVVRGILVGIAQLLSCHSRAHTHTHFTSHTYIISDVPFTPSSLGVHQKHVPYPPCVFI